MIEICPRCGATVPRSDGPVHAYVPASAGCWALFGEVQADQLTRQRHAEAHCLVVDTYLAQHPGDGRDRRDRQSVFVHLVALYLRLERHLDNAQVIEAMRRTIDGDGDPDFPVLTRRDGPGPITIASMVGPDEMNDFGARARKWARSVWESWADQHERIRAWADRKI